MLKFSIQGFFVFLSRKCNFYIRYKRSWTGRRCVKSQKTQQIWVYFYRNVCTVPKMQNIKEGVWWKQGVTVGHQSQIWSLPASWQCFSPWLMFSDDNIWPLKLWLFLAALNGQYCGISSVGLISCSLTQPLCLFLTLSVSSRQSCPSTPLHVTQQLCVCGTCSKVFILKPRVRLEAAEAFLSLSSFKMDKLFCMGV